MEKARKYWKEILLGLIVIAAGIWTYLSRPKFGFIKTGALLEQYEGFKEARQKFELRKARLLSSVDSLEKDLVFEINKYKRDSAKYSSVERKAILLKISRLQYDYNENKEVAGRKIEEDDSKILESVLVQVNSYIEKYGNTHGYDIIFGTLESGNVLYGKKSRDLTEEILKGLNNEYNGK